MLDFSLPHLGRALALAAVLVTATAASAAPHRQRPAHAYVTDVNRSAARVQRELRMARAHLGPGAARCVSNKLSMIHAQGRVAERHLAAFRTASSRGDRHAAAQHQVGLRIARDHAEDLSRSVVSCLSFGATERVVRR